MRISSLNTSLKESCYKVSLKANQSEQAQRKREYLDSKTDGLYGLGTILLVLGLLLDGVNNSMSKKRTTKQKFGLGFLFASIVVCISAIVRQIKFSLKYKEVEKENDQ